jgi:hypothetical protein
MLTIQLQMNSNALQELQSASGEELHRRGMLMPSIPDNVF